MRRCLCISLPTAAALAVVALPLAAGEQHNLYNYNGWKVDLVVRDDSSLACVAGTLNERDELFAVRIDPREDVSVHVIFRNPESGVRPLNLSIHGVMNWELGEFRTSFFGGSFTFWDDVDGKAFLEDLAKGRTLSVSSPTTNQILARFLLNGSGPALASLTECSSMIKGAGV